MATLRETKPLKARVNGLKTDNRLIVYLEPGQRERLDDLSASTGARLTELVRRAIDKYLSEAGLISPSRPTAAKTRG